MKQLAVSAQDLTGHSLYKLLFTALFAVYPLMALTTSRGYRAIPILLLLLALVALVRKVRAWPPSMTQWAWALTFLTAPFYLSYIFGGLEAPSMERVSYGWLFLIIGAAACVTKPRLDIFAGALVVGACVTLAVQLITGGARPSLEFNPIPYAEVAAAFFCLLCIFLTKAKRWPQFVMLILGMAGWLVVIALTQTRGAMLATLPGLIYLLVHLVKRFGPKISVTAVVVLCVLAVAGDALMGQVVSQRFQLAAADLHQYQNSPETFSSTAVRIELWRAALMVVREHPMGQGEEGARNTALEWSKEGRLQTYVQPQLEVAHFHSDYFQQLAVAGYPGLLGLLLFYGLLLRYFFRHRGQLAGALGLVATLSYMVSGLTDVPLYNRLTLFTFFVLITLCFASIAMHTQKRHSPRGASFPSRQAIPT